MGSAESCEQCSGQWCTHDLVSATPTLSPTPAPTPTPTPAPMPKLGHYCGNKQEGDGCGVDHRSKGWCSESMDNCDQCSGQWCASEPETPAAVGGGRRLSLRGASRPRKCCAIGSELTGANIFDTP